MTWSAARMPLAKITTKIDYGVTASATSTNTGNKFLRITDIQDGSVDWGKVPYCTADQRKLRSSALENGDLVFARTGATTGKSFLLKDPPDGAVFASYLIRVKPSKRVEPSFLAHFFQTNEYWSQIRRKTQGAAQGGVNATSLSEVEVPVPPLDEQRRIAAILDKADALYRRCNSAGEKISELKDSLFVSIFGGCKLGQGQWPATTVGEAGFVQLGRQRAPQYQTGKHSCAYVRVANVYEDRVDLNDVLSMDFDESDIAKYNLAHGDILLNEGQSTELVGRPAMWRAEIDRCCFQNTLVRFRADSARVNSDFALAVFLRYFRAGEFAKISSKTSSVAHLGAGRFAAMPFPLPPLVKQDEYAERLNAIRRLDCAMQARTADFHSLFASLQHRAFSGQL